MARPSPLDSCSETIQKLRYIFLEIGFRFLAVVRFVVAQPAHQVLPTVVAFAAFDNVVDDEKVCGAGF